MIDLHSHVLPGLDDGAPDAAASLAMLRAFAADGVEVVVATPHVRDDFPTTAERMRQALEQVRAAAGAEGLPVEVLSGGEVAMEVLPHLDARERAAFSLGGNERLMLVETPYHGWSTLIETSIVGLATTGVTPVLAHPERNPAVQSRPELLVPLVREGTIVQLTAASVDGRLGKRPAAAARALLDAGLAHVVASDAHTPDGCTLSSVAAALGDAGLARWLTADMPQALLTGGVLPAPIASRRRRFSLRRRG